MRRRGLRDASQELAAPETQPHPGRLPPGGTVAAGSRRQGPPVKRGLQLWMGITALTLAVLVLSGAIIGAVWNRMLLSMSREAASAHAVVAASRTLEQSLINLQAGGLGYLATGQNSALREYRSALAAYPGDLTTLSRLTGHDRAARQYAAVISRQLGLLAGNVLQPAVAQRAAGRGGQVPAVAAAGTQAGTIEAEIGALGKRVSAAVAARRAATEHTATFLFRSRSPVPG
jgi:CHASE3 domain sensor protein